MGEVIGDVIAIAIGILLLAAAGLGINAVIRDVAGWIRRRPHGGGDSALATTSSPGTSSGTAGADSFEDDARQVRAEAQNLRAELGEYPERWQLETSARFASVATRLRSRNPSLETLVRLARDSDPWTSRIALAALAGREDLPLDWPSYAVRKLRQAPYDLAWLLLRTLEGVPDPVVGPVLSRSSTCTTAMSPS